MYRGTTPTYTFKLKDDTVDLTQASNVYVTFAKADKTEIFTKTGEDLDVQAKQVSVFLTQEETLSFPVGYISAQVNWVYADGTRSATKIVQIQADTPLKDEVLQ